MSQSQIFFNKSTPSLPVKRGQHITVEAPGTNEIMLSQDLPQKTNLRQIMKIRTRNLQQSGDILN
jgi:hypothetical protein